MFEDKLLKLLDNLEFTRYIFMMLEKHKWGYWTVIISSPKPENICQELHNIIMILFMHRFETDLIQCMKCVTFVVGRER